MKKNIAFSLSLQREIEKRRLNVESEVNKSMNELGARTLLNQSGIRKEKGISTVSLLFVLLVLPVIKQSLSAVWSGKFFENLIRAQKDTYYRFLNHPCFNWRKLVSLLVCREIARTDRTPFNEKTLIADDTIVGKTGENMELVSYHHDHTTNRSKLGYQMLQLGYHNGTRFYPLDMRNNGVRSQHLTNCSGNGPVESSFRAFFSDEYFERTRNHVGVILAIRWPRRSNCC